MKKYLYLLFMAAVLFMLTGCPPIAKPIPAHVEDISFSLTEATKFVEKIDQPLFELLQKENITVGEFKALLMIKEATYTYSEPDELGKIITITKTKPQFTCEDYLTSYMENFFDEDWLAYAGDLYPDTYVIDFLKDRFYPTIFHKDIEVTDAYIRTYSNPSNSLEIYDEELYVIESFVGNDEELTNFNREYRFKKNNDGEWDLVYSINVSLFIGEGFTKNYLPAK